MSQDTMKREIAVGYYLGDHKVWDTVYIEVPSSFDADDTDEIVRQVFRQYPQWGKETIAFVADLGESVDGE